VLTNEQITFYKENGYLILSGFFPEKKISKLSKEAKQILFTQVNYFLYGNTYRFPYYETDIFDLMNNLQLLMWCGKAIQHLPSLHKLGLNKQLFRVLKELGLQWPTISTRPVVFFHHKKLAKSEINYKTPPHQDWASIQQSTNGVVVWLPLMDCTKKAVGPLEVVPKSHLEGCIATKMVESFGVVEKYKDEDFIPLPAKEGDIIIFSQFLVHRSGDNRSNVIRWTANFRYSDLAEADWIKRGYPNYYTYKSEAKLK